MPEQYCIMPEMPYCPACPFGYIEQPLYDNANCEWHCLCTKEKYEKYMSKHKED